MVGKGFFDIVASCQLVKNFFEIALSCTISEINAFLGFNQKFKRAKNGREMILRKSCQLNLQLPVDFRSISHHSRDKYILGFCAEIQDGC